MAAVVAQRDSAIVARWLALLQQILTLSREQLMSATGLDHTALGNYCFELLRNELAAGVRSVPGEVLPQFTRLHRKLQRYRLLKSQRQRYILQLDPDKNGYIVERNHRRRDPLSARERYRAFWFSESLPLSAAADNAGALIALHRSWTPVAYSRLGFGELDQNRTLLSRYQRSLLGGLAEGDLAVFNRHKPEEI
ncbi:MAG: hypothetical protein IPG06_13700 [Haliea sp.]|nr:hypothetical protein [Haliea sp.]